MLMTIARRPPPEPWLVPAADPELTVLLQRMAAGESGAAGEVAAAVSRDLHAIAAACLRGERKDHTLQATALVNEAWAALLRREAVRWENRGAFFGVAALAMRHVLVDHARARGRQKRGGDLQRLPFDVVLEAFAPRPLDDAELLDLDEALVVLARVEPRAARVLELRFFAGLSVAETAEALGVSAKTVELDFRAARAWLKERLGREGAP